MQQAVLARQNRHECPEVDDASHRTLVDLTYLGFSRNFLNSRNRGVLGGGIFGVNSHAAVIIDIYFRAGFFDDRTDGRTALANNVADLVGMNIHRHHGWCIGR